MPTSEQDLDDLLRAVAESPPIPIANLVGGRFALRGRLGEGAFGVVYEAEDRSRRRRVALKLLRHPRPDWIYRFKREFRALCDLTHRNLVALDELFCLGHHWCYTMELLDGVDVLAYTQREERRIRDVIAQLADGLAAVHDRGHVHRDLKPSNVLVTHDRRVVILDFGLATQPSTGERATASAIVGTPAYMAPEQAAGHAVTSAADLYAVGVLLHEMLTGTRPGRDRRSLEAAGARDLARCCDALLDADPARRPTAVQLAARLRVREAQGGSRRSPRANVIERTHELAALRRAFEATRCGERVVCVVHGDSATGKSRTVRALLDELRRDGEVLVLEGRCHEREDVPYKAIDGVVDSLVAHLRSLPAAEVAAVLPAGAAALAKVFPALLRVPWVEHQVSRLRCDLPGVETRALGALREVLARLGAARPVVIAIDDLHWADEDGLRALAEVMCGPTAPSLFVVGTFRTTGDPLELAMLATALATPIREIRLAARLPSAKS